MPSSMCLRCLKRSLTSIEASSAPNTVQRAAFSTTPTLSVNPPKKKGVVAKPAARQGPTLRLTKKKRASNTRPPAIGERKALRKRVVLSNTNALEVKGLPNLQASNSTSERLQLAQDRVLGLDNDTVDALRALEAFKPTQGWSLFRRPATLIRKETVELAGDLDWIAEESGGRSVQKVLFGERGSGKSVLQLQALAMASLRGWIIVHIPEAKDLTNAHTSYEPMETENGTIYIQPHYTAKLLENLHKVNGPVLSKFTVRGQHSLPVTLPANASLARLAEVGSKDPDLAWPVWQALWSELLTPGVRLPPVLFSLDGFDHVMRDSAYLNAEAEPIHAHELTIVKNFIDLLAGRKTLPNGGMILAATSESNRAAAHTLDHSLKRNEAIQKEQQPPAWDPYVMYDKWVQDALKTVGVTKLTGLSKQEARGLMEYYARSGMLRSTVTHGLVSETWTLAGGGIIGQIEKGSVKAMRV